MILFNIMLGKSRGGLEQVALDYATILQKVGWDVTLVGHPKGWLAAQAGKNPSFAIWPLKSFGDHDPIALWRLSQYVRAKKPDLIIAHGTRAMRYCAEIPISPKIGVLHNMRFKPVMGRMDALFSVSPPVTEAAQALFPQTPVFLVPNMVHRFSDALRPPFRKPMIIGFLGRLHPNKGLDVLFQALSQPEILALDWQLHVAGDGPEAGHLRHLAKTLGLDPRITWLGWIENKERFFAALDLFVLPSREEPFGLVVVEAMAAQLPVLATDTAGPCFILEDRKTGLIVAKNDPEALATGLLTLLSQQDLARSLGQAGRKSAEKRFSQKAVAEHLITALNLIISRELKGEA